MMIMLCKMIYLHCKVVCKRHIYCGYDLVCVVCSELTAS